MNSFHLNPLSTPTYVAPTGTPPLTARQSEALPAVPQTDTPVEICEPTAPVDQNATTPQAAPGEILQTLVAQRHPVNAVALKAAFPQFEGLLDGEVSPADIQHFGSLLESLQTGLNPAELQQTLVALAQVAGQGEGQVPQLLEMMQQALPVQTLDAALMLAQESGQLQELSQHAETLLNESTVLLKAEIAPASPSPAGCAAAYTKLAARQQEQLKRLDGEIGRLNQQIALASPAQAPDLEALRQRLGEAKDLLSLSQSISQCLSKQAGVHKNYPIDIRLAGYAAINDLSSVQLKELGELSQQLQQRLAQPSGGNTELLQAAAWTARLGEAVSSSLLDPSFREATQTLSLDTHPAAVALQYGQHTKLVENGEAEISGKPRPHKNLGWYHPSFGSRPEDFIQVRLNGPQNQQILRERVDGQLRALTALSADELRAGKGEQLRAEIRADLKSRLISERSIESFMGEIDTRLEEVKSLQPTLTTADVSVPQGKAMSKTEIAAYAALYQDLVNRELKSSTDPSVKKYVKALELLQLQPQAGDGARYLENARAQAEQLLKDSVDSPAVKKIFESARQQAVLLACDPAIASKGANARANLFDIVPTATRQAQAEDRIKQLVTFIEGAADQGIDVTEQLSMLQAMAPEKFQQMTQQMLQQELMEQIAAKALADPKLQPRIAAGQREMLKQAVEGLQTPDAAAFRLAVDKLTDAQVLNFCQQLKAQGTDRADNLVKLCKRFFGDNIEAVSHAKTLGTVVNGPRLGGAISLGGVMLGLFGEGMPKGVKLAEDSSAFLKALGESTLSQEKLTHNTKVRGVLGSLGLIEGSSKLMGLLQSGKFESKDLLTVAEGTAGIIEGGVNAYSGLKGIKAEQLLSRRGEMFLKGVGKLAAVASIVIDSQASVKAGERKDYVGQATAAVQVGAGTAGLIATCAGSGPLGWAALAVYGAAMGIDAVFGMSEDAEKVMDLRNDAGLSQEMQGRYDRVATYYNGKTSQEYPHARILANIAEKPAAERNLYRAAVIHTKLEEALTSDHDEDLIHSLINQAHQEGPAAFDGLIDQLGTRMLGYVLEKDKHLEDLLGKLLTDKLDVGPDSKFAQLLTGLAENHQDEILTQVLTTLKFQYPQKAAALAPETLIALSDKFMSGQTDSYEQKAIFELLNTFATDAQFGALMQSGEASRFFKDLSSELAYDQTARLLGRALTVDIRQNQGIRTAEHLFSMAEFGVGAHNQRLYSAVNAELATLSKTHTGNEAAQLQRFGAWIEERHPSRDEDLLKAIFVPAAGQVFDEAVELSQYQREQTAARLSSRMPDVMTAVRVENATVALRELAKLEAAQITPGRIEPLLLTLLQAQGSGDAQLKAQSDHQLARLKQLLPTLDLPDMQKRANQLNAGEVQTYRQFVTDLDSHSPATLVKRVQADARLLSYLSRAW